MRLVWVVVPLVLFGIIGMQESFAEEETWWLGENLKQGDYFSYNLCHIDYKDCTPFQIDLWIERKIDVDSEPKWLTKVVVYDEDKIVQGKIKLGTLAAEPISFDDDLSDYAIIFRSSVSWLAAFTSENHPGKLTGSFDDSLTWNSIGDVGTILEVSGSEIIHVGQIAYDAAVLQWNFGDIENKFWVVDEFPFPIKADVWTHTVEDIPVQWFKFELLEHHENVLEDPFVPIIPFEESFASICEPIELAYTMEEGTISEACFSKDAFTIYATIENNEAGKISIEIPDSVVFRSAWACSDNWYDLLIDGRWASFNTNLMLSEKILEFEIPKKSSKIEISPVGPMNTIHKGFVEQCIYESLHKISPHSQKKMGIPAYDTICKNSFELIFKSSDGSPACVKPKTAEKLIERGWALDEKPSDQMMETNNQPTIVAKPVNIELDPILYSGGPISSKMIEIPRVTDSSIAMEPTIFPSDKEIIISNLPRVDDIIDITFIATYQPIQPHTFENAIVAFHITDTLEFLTVPEGYELEYTEPQSSWGKQYPGIYSLKVIDPIIFDSDVPQEFTVQAKAVSEGITTISAGVFDEQAKLDIVIGSTETLLRNDYYVKYPQEIPESIQLPTSPEEQAAFEKKYGVSFGTTTIKTDITEEEYHIWLENYGLSENEINEILERVFG